MAVQPAEIAAGTVPVELTAPAAGGGRLLRSGGLALSLALLVVIFGACFIWPLVGSVPRPTGGSVLNANLSIGAPGHLLGTDPVGNDELSRLLYGGRASLEVALAIVLGGLLGALAAYVGGVLDAVIMRFLDMLIAFPSLVLALAIAEGLGPGEVHTIWALAFFSVPAFARVARAETLKVRERPFVAAAQLAGSRRWRILGAHIAPNILPQLITFAFLGMGITVVLEGALSFLGLGIPAPAPSWGNMIAQGQSVLSAQPRFVLLPSAALCLAVIAFNMLGDALRARWAG